MKLISFPVVILSSMISEDSGCSSDVFEYELKGGGFATGCLEKKR